MHKAANQVPFFCQSTGCSVFKALVSCFAVSKQERFGEAGFGNIYSISLLDIKIAYLMEEITGFKLHTDFVLLGFVRI